MLIYSRKTIKQNGGSAPPKTAKQIRSKFTGIGLGFRRVGKAVKNGVVATGTTIKKGIQTGLTQVAKIPLLTYTAPKAALGTIGYGAKAAVSGIQSALLKRKIKSKLGVVASDVENKLTKKQKAIDNIATRKKTALKNINNKQYNSEKRNAEIKKIESKYDTLSEKAINNQKKYIQRKSDKLTSNESTPKPTNISTAEQLQNAIKARATKLNANANTQKKFATNQLKIANDNKTNKIANYQSKTKEILGLESELSLTKQRMKAATGQEYINLQADVKSLKNQINSEKTKLRAQRTDLNSLSKNVIAKEKLLGEATKKYQDTTTTGLQEKLTSARQSTEKSVKEIDNLYKINPDSGFAAIKNAYKAPVSEITTKVKETIINPIRKGIGAIKTAITPEIFRGKSSNVIGQKIKAVSNNTSVKGVERLTKLQKESVRRMKSANIPNIIKQNKSSDLIKQVFDALPTIIDGKYKINENALNDINNKENELVNAYQKEINVSKQNQIRNELLELSKIKSYVKNIKNLDEINQKLSIKLALAPA